MEIAGVAGSTNRVETGETIKTGKALRTKDLRIDPEVEGLRIGGILEETKQTLQERLS